MECYLLSFLNWDRTTLFTKFKLSALTLNNAKVFEKAETRIVVIADFNVAKAHS